MWLPSGKWKLLASPVPEHPNYKPPLKPWLGWCACPAVCAGEGRAHKPGQGGVGDGSLWATLRHRQCWEGPRTFDTSVRSPLSCLWGVMCQQAAAGPRATIPHSGLHSSPWVGRCPAQPTPRSHSLPGASQGSSLWKPGGRGVRQYISRAGAPWTHWDALLGRLVLSRATG